VGWLSRNETPAMRRPLMLRPPAHTIWCRYSALDEMHREAERVKQNETGGVLLGWSGPDLAITRVVGPGPSARHGARTFEPDYDWQEKQIAELYESSGRRLSYLGDWHTHPGGSVTPSPTDLRTIRNIAACAEARCPRPLMAILGGPTTDGWELGVFAKTSARKLIRWHDVRAVRVRFCP
jgi:integrative and conjugative element protein (TIGR02256 family)